MEVEKEFYSLKELATVLDMCYATVDRAVTAGNIIVVNMGGERKIPKKEFERVKAEGFVRAKAILKGGVKLPKKIKVKK